MRLCSNETPSSALGLLPVWLLRAYYLKCPDLRPSPQTVPESVLDLMAAIQVLRSPFMKSLPINYVLSIEDTLLIQRYK